MDTYTSPIIPVKTNGLRVFTAAVSFLAVFTLLIAPFMMGASILDIGNTATALSEYTGGGLLAMVTPFIWGMFLVLLICGYFNIQREGNRIVCGVLAGVSGVLLLGSSLALLGEVSAVYAATTGEKVVSGSAFYLSVLFGIALIVCAFMIFTEKSMLARRRVGTFAKYVVLIAVGLIMVYPLLWMVSATFKSNNEIFGGSIGLIPRDFTMQGWSDAMKNYGGDLNIWRSMLNTYSYVIPKVLFTVISATLTAYGFGRFKFKGHGVLFALMVSMLFLPQVVLNVPQYIMYNQFGWIDSPWYAPIIVPTLFATESYFVFMLVQFMRNIPRELDEAAKIDGCNSFQILTKVIVPMLKPAIVSAGLFQFMWSSNDFMGPLLYITTQSRKPASLFVKLSMDADTGFSWNRVLAVSLISIAPSLIVFFAAQDQFIDGISAGAVKG